MDATEQTRRLGFLLRPHPLPGGAGEPVCGGRNWGDGIEPGTCTAVRPGQRPPVLDLNYEVLAIIKRTQSATSLRSVVADISYFTTSWSCTARGARQLLASRRRLV